ncbi:MAG: TetR/AcrR family transcriptional regulator [Clostridiales bacterium]|nr:TetR/AcrR family transcriptional regulator [Clostridiales bacterium]
MKITPAKERIIQALEELLLRRDLDDIYVSDIVRASGISRKTFYRNFQDKYDLVNYYFYHFYLYSFDQITEGAEWEDALHTYLSICEKKAPILIHAYGSKDANCLKNYDVEMTEKTYQKYLLQKGVDITAGEMQFAIKIAASGGTAMIIDWMKTGMHEDKATLVALIKRTLPRDILKHL